MAFTRLAAHAPSIFEVIRDDGSKLLRNLQHSLSQARDDASKFFVVEALIRLDDPSHPRHLAIYKSHCGDPTTWGLIPNDPATTFSNSITEVGIKRRPLLPIQNILGSERRQCPTCFKTLDEPIADGGGCQVDVYGDYAIRCTRSLAERTELWHDPLVRQFHSLTKMAGVPCAMKVCDFIIDSQARPDHVLFSTDNSQVDTMICVRTADTTGLKKCISAAARAGAAPDTSEMLKNRKWLVRRTSSLYH